MCVAGLSGSWRDFLRLVAVLQGQRALEDRGTHFEYSPLGLVARDLRGSNELWLAPSPTILHAPSPVSIVSSIPHLLPRLLSFSHSLTLTLSHSHRQAHLHCAFAAVVDHEGQAGEERTQTKFLSLDKCIPGRHYLQWVEFPDADGPKAFSYDAEWLSILTQAPEPDASTSTRCHRPSPEDVAQILERFDGDLTIPENFTVTAPPHDPAVAGAGVMPMALLENPQTVSLLRKLGIGQRATEPVAPETNPEVIDVDVDSTASDDS